MPEILSRERLSRALRHQPTDYVPCCFMSFTALRRRTQENMYELVKAEQAM
jgi:uroporphyrinogen-III decarboxylase